MKFSNGTHNDYFTDARCSTCAYWRPVNDTGPGCPIMDLHFVAAHDDDNTRQKICDAIIPNDSKPGQWPECMCYMPNMQERARLWEIEKDKNKLEAWNNGEGIKAKPLPTPAYWSER